MHSTDRSQGLYLWLIRVAIFGAQLCGLAELSDKAVSEGYEHIYNGNECRGGALNFSQALPTRQVLVVGSGILHSHDLAC